LLEGKRGYGPSRQRGKIEQRVKTSPNGNKNNVNDRATMKETIFHKTKDDNSISGHKINIKAQASLGLRTV